MSNQPISHNAGPQVDEETMAFIRQSMPPIAYIREVCEMEDIDKAQTDAFCCFLSKYATATALNQRYEEEHMEQLYGTMT